MYRSSISILHLLLLLIPFSFCFITLTVFFWSQMLRPKEAKKRKRRGRDFVLSSSPSSLQKRLHHSVSQFHLSPVSRVLCPTWRGRRRKQKEISFSFQFFWDIVTTSIALLYQLAIPFHALQTSYNHFDGFASANVKNSFWYDDLRASLNTHTITQHTIWYACKFSKLQEDDMSRVHGEWNFKFFQ